MKSLKNGLFLAFGLVFLIAFDVLYSKIFSTPIKHMLRTTRKMCTKAINESNMNKTIHPGQSFYQYVNGGWLNTNKIPPEHSSWNAFRELDEQSKINLKTIFEDLLNNNSSFGDSRLVSELYRSGLDVELVEKANVEPINDLLLEIKGIQDIQGISKIIGKLHLEGFTFPFWFFILILGLLMYLQTAKTVK